jgi:hypothetical protein
MKSKLSKKKAVSEFPKLMISHDSDIVVFFSSSTSGMTINCDNASSGSAHRLGYYSITWSPDEFKDYKGVVKLKNS